MATIFILSSADAQLKCSLLPELVYCVYASHYCSHCAVVSGSPTLIVPGARYFSVSVDVGYLLIHNYSWVWMPQYTFYQYVLVPQEDILMKNGLVETGEV